MWRKYDIWFDLNYLCFREENAKGSVHGYPVGPDRSRRKPPVLALSAHRQHAPHSLQCSGTHGMDDIYIICQTDNPSVWTAICKYDIWLRDDI